jgi:DNA-binding transcriptional regulator YdaS (Cro superfamily)
MKTQTAITLAGSRAKLARLLGVSRPAVTQYKEVLPPKRIARLREVHPEWFVDTAPLTEIHLEPADLQLV